MKSNPCVYLNQFRANEDFIVAAVVLDDASRPQEVYLVPGTAWGTDTSGCLGRNDGGGAGGPYMEIRTTASTHAGELAKYAFDRVAPRL